MRSEGGKMPTLNAQTQDKEEDDLRGEKRRKDKGPWRGDRTNSIVQCLMVKFR